MLIIKIRSELVHSPIRIFNENGYEIFNDLDYIYNDKKLLSLKIIFKTTLQLICGSSAM